MITSLVCPHCGQQGITMTRKLFLGPLASASCRACGKQISVAYTAVLAQLPLLIAVLLSAVVDPVWLRVALLIAGFGLTGLVYTRWVPLTKR